MSGTEEKVSTFFKEYLEREIAFSTYYGVALFKTPFFEEVKKITHDLETKWKASKKLADSDFVPKIRKIDEDTDEITLSRSQRDDLLFLLKNTTEENYNHFLKRYALQQLLSELENYLNLCFRYMLRKKPSILNEHSILFKDIDEKVTYDKIIDSVISDKLYHLFYKDYASVFKFAKKMGIKHKIDAEMLNNLNEVKLLRDLYVHSDGIVNKKFLEKTKLNKHLPKGVKIPLETNLIINIRSLIRDIVVTFDRQFIYHFPKAIDQKFQYERFLKNAEKMTQVFPTPPKHI